MTAPTAIWGNGKVWRAHFQQNGCAQITVCCTGARKNKLLANTRMLPLLFYLSLGHMSEEMDMGVEMTLTINIFLNVLAQKRVQPATCLKAERTEMHLTKLHLDKQKTVPFQG